MTLWVFTTPEIYGQNNNALHFDGLSNMVDCGNPAAVQITGTSLTLEAWIKADSWQSQVFEGNILNKESNGLGIDYGYMMRVGDNGKVNFNIGNGYWTELTTSSILTIGQWHHIACVYDGDSMMIFVDGNQAASQATSISISNATANLALGNQPGEFRYFNGAIDEVRIWNVARTATEILSYKDLEIVSTTPGLAAYYRFNQGTAGGDNTGITTLYDSTSNAVDGTLNNFMLMGSTSNWVAGAPIGTVNTQNVLAEDMKINIYPNPVTANSNFTIELPQAQEAIIQVFNLQGQLLKTQNSNTDKATINTTDLTKGVYMVKVIAGNTTYTQRLIIQ